MINNSTRPKNSSNEKKLSHNKLKNILPVTILIYLRLNSKLIKTKNYFKLPKYTMINYHSFQSVNVITTEKKFFL